MSDALRKWWNISLFNLLLVVLLGLVLRYKIAFYLPWIHQKHVLHAHSHFAFSGWVSQTLMVWLVAYVSDIIPSLFNKYKPLLVLHLITCYGMLLTFPFMGYALPSIAFSTLSLWVFYVFAVLIWRDLNQLPSQPAVHLWFKSGLLFFVLSSMGTYLLAYMMATKSIDQHLYLATVYFFLHFQYNGWFFFGGVGVLLYLTSRYVALPSNIVRIFWMLTISCVPAYFLSALWMPIPRWLYALVVLSAFIQLVAWVQLFQLLYRLRQGLFIGKAPVVRNMILLSAIALSIKFLLQLGSTIPSLSHLAYGFRPVVIGYLHLVLLGGITMFLLAIVLHQRFGSLKIVVKSGAVLFIAGVVLNEVILMLQGMTGMLYIPFPWANEILFGVAILLFLSVLLINSSALKKNSN